jgi:6-phosphogluconate dehydrogenase
MKLGFIGLGRMGSNMVLNLAEKGHKIVALNRSPEPTRKLAKKKNITGAYSIEELISKLPKQKIVWLMIPSGKPVDDTIASLLTHLKKGDIIIDGGNSYFKDSQRRYKALKRKGINFLDCGTSGGIEGARNGACMMIGGDKGAFKKTEKLFKDMCVKDGYGYMGESGAGHFVKGMHNGIEYGMMGALAEGLSGIQKHNKEFKTDLKEVAKVYAHGSIISGRLASWLQQGVNRKYYNKISGSVPKGETEEEMAKLEKMAPLKILHQARLMRVKTRRSPSLIGKLIAVMRNEFGGHKFKKK